MIQAAAKTIAKWLLASGAISADDLKLYQYGIFCVLFSMIPFVLVLFIGIPLGMGKEALLMIIPFFLIRKFCGGFHLKSSVSCLIASTAVLTAFLLGIRWILHSESYPVMWISILISLASIFAFSPIDSENRQLSEKEKIVFRKIAVGLSLIIAAVCGVMTVCNCHWGAVSVGSGLVLSAVLQLPCLLKKYPLKKEELHMP